MTTPAAMTLRFSSELAANEGRIFIAYAPPYPLLVMGRRDPRTGELCVAQFYWKPRSDTLRQMGIIKEH